MSDHESKWTEYFLYGMFVLVMAVGCSGCVPWQAYRHYEGPERSLEEVAVLFVWRPVFVESIDDDENVPSLRESSNFNLFEYHLLPGSHSITAFYRRKTEPSRYLYGESITRNLSFEAGYVYEIKGGTDLSYSPMSEGQWNMSIHKVGSVDEYACTLGRESVDNAPGHWKKNEYYDSCSQ